MESEERTFLRIYDSNGVMGYEELTEGLSVSDVLSMIGMLDLVKLRVLTYLNEDFGENIKKEEK